MAKQITSTQATTLCNNFDKKYNELCKFIKKDDNRSCLLSLEELKEYIVYLENENKKIDGIRVYFGSYSENEKNAIDNGLSTVFFAPTSQGVDNTKLNAFNVFGSGRPPKKKYSK